MLETVKLLEILRIVRRVLSYATFFDRSCLARTDIRWSEVIKLKANWGFLKEEGCKCKDEDMGGGRWCVIRNNLITFSISAPLLLWSMRWEMRRGRGEALRYGSANLASSTILSAQGNILFNSGHQILLRTKQP